MLKYVIFTFFVLTTTACKSGLDKNIEIQQGSEQSLVLIGVKVLGNESPTFTFRRYDQDSGNVIYNRNIVTGTTDVARVTANKDKANTANIGINLSKPEILAFTVKPGTWFLYQKNVLIEKPAREFTRYVTDYNNGAFAFNVSAGEVVYIGNYELEKAGFQPLGNGLVAVKPDMAAAVKKLEGFPNVHSKAKHVTPYSVTFTCGKAETLVGVDLPFCEPLVVSKASAAE